MDVDQKKFMNRRGCDMGITCKLVLKKKQKNWPTLEERNSPQLHISSRGLLILEATPGFPY